MVQEYQIKKMLKSKGIDPSTIDYRAMWDSSLTPRENIDIIKREIRAIAPPEDIIQKGRYITKMLKSSGKQKGDSIFRIDKSRKALPCGKRETWYDKIYYENRKNRCDLKGGV